MRSQFKLVGKSLKINKIHKYSLKEADKLKKNIFQSEPLDPSQWNYATTKIRKKMKVSRNKNWNQILQLGMKWFIKWQLKVFGQFIIFKATDEGIANPGEHRKKKYH